MPQQPIQLKEEVRAVVVWVVCVINENEKIVYDLAKLDSREKKV